MTTNILLTLIAVLLLARIFLQVWQVWQEEQKKYALSVAWVGNGINGANSMMFFRTSTDRDKCIEVIDAFISQIQQSKSVASLCEEINAIIEKYSKK